MTKRIFQLLGVIGIIAISVLAFVIPTNPYKTISALTMMSFDKPLWLCLIVGGGFIYLVTLYSIYDKLTNK